MSLVDYPSSSDSDSEAGSDSNSHSENKRAREEENGEEKGPEEHAGKRPEHMEKSLSEDFNLTYPLNGQARNTSITSSTTDLRTPANIDTPPPPAPLARIRTTPHIEGNWATFVYFAINPTPTLVETITSILHTATTHIPTLQAIPLLDNNDGGAPHYHVSLSRTFFLKVFQIERFVEVLRGRVRGGRRFTIGVSRISTYTNDDRTRSFLGLDVGVGFRELGGFHRQLQVMTRQVDDAVRQFSKQTYHETPAFHASIAWAPVPPSSSSSTQQPQSQLSVETTTHLKSFERALALERFLVKAVVCRAGNRVYEVPLDG
ncbi:uncharacterized protein EV422DRAFT_567371 [Fimicolochytrium jonesii]|uniref:uncharacterized protein n=1 Tax=Fimicolochytrium jonesii TaxID=1396493 RepID=UPI0022FEBE6F|nr:uncharacterized protein EV422DRAFT_567371 [Fimicolochytrium jonesii]KAI8821046.1 hypothetical protein EV422DRAFT_567371 [Fimicolochytrium jonesii]